MAEETHTVTTAIITLIVIFVIGIVVYTIYPEAFSQITGIAEEVFKSEEIERQQATTLTTEAYKNLTEDISTYCTGTSTDKCLCYRQGFGMIAEDSFFYFQNNLSAKKVRISVVNDQDVILSQEEKGYNVGLFVVYKDGEQRKLGCYFPDKFQIEGFGEATWFVRVQEERLDRRSEIYATQEPSDVSTHQPLTQTPQLYKIDAAKVCILSRIIDQDYPATSTDVQAGKLVEVASVGTEEHFWGLTEQTAFDDIYSFFQADNYCNKPVV